MNNQGMGQNNNMGMNQMGMQDPMNNQGMGQNNNMGMNQMNNMGMNQMNNMGMNQMNNMGMNQMQMMNSGMGMNQMQMMNSGMGMNQMQMMNNLMTQMNMGNLSQQALNMMMNFNNGNNANNANNNQNNSQNENSGKMTVIFRVSGNAGESQAPLMIQCLPNEKVSQLIQRYRTKSGDEDESKKFIFNAKNLVPSLTISEAGISNNSNIFVVVTKGIKGAK